MNVDISNFPERVAILRAIHRGIDQINDMNPGKPPIEKAPHSKLFGTGALDSLGIVNLVTEIEADLKRQVGVEIVIVQDIFDLDNHPLETVQSLADHIERVLAKKRQSMQKRD